MFAAIMLAVAGQAAALPDPGIVGALRRYGDCFRREVTKLHPTLATRINAYATAEKACVEVRKATASTIETVWRERGDLKTTRTTPDRYVGYFLETEKLEIDTYLIAQRPR